jgi:hypothetical protein
MMELYFHSPVHLHELSTGRVLPSTVDSKSSVLSSGYRHNYHHEYMFVTAFVLASLIRLQIEEAPKASNHVKAAVMS